MIRQGARKPESKAGKDKPPPVKEQGDTKKGEKPAEPKPKPPARAGPAPAPTATAPAIPGATTDGSLSEWAYHQFGVVGLASRVWQGPELPEPRPAAAGAPAGAIPADGEARWLFWNDHVMGGRAFVPFAPFDHVALGKIELGGWKPGVRLNPPVEQVGSLARGHVAFLVELAQRLPRLAIRDVKVEAKGGGIFQVSATVANDGELPTALAQGVRTRKADPVRVRLDPGTARILAGPARARSIPWAVPAGTRSSAGWSWRPTRQGRRDATDDHAPGLQPEGGAGPRGDRAGEAGLATDGEGDLATDEHR